MSSLKWKKIPEHPKYSACEDGRIRNDMTGKTIKLSKHRNTGSVLSGYLTAWVDGKHRKVHRLIASTFVENPRGKPWVNHIDENKSNNYCSNLIWSTALENCHHSVKLVNRRYQLVDTDLSMRRRGQDNPNSKLSDLEVEDLRNKYKSGEYKVVDLAAMFKISGKHVSSLARGFYRGKSN